MAKLLDKEGITSFQKIYQLSQEISDEFHQQSNKSTTQINSPIHFWDFEEDEAYETLTNTKQVA
ncbi:MAG: hypothetical protein FD167_3155 [bacterium]|nr:MAG: hypothetical protein FD167_3155 [bacterium]